MEYEQEYGSLRWNIPPEKREQLSHLIRETLLNMCPAPPVARWYHPITGSLLKLFDKGRQLFRRNRASDEHRERTGKSL